ncbi:MAG TPA: hypothetical protein VFE61_09895 [Candidatus Sulfotelmatobacter sp.]|nr:hypothetical protein [Candidatus Sulfotelmatobacter sp.]
MRQCGIAVLLAVSTVVLAAVPGGWKVVTDRKKTCQYAVPADRTPDSVLVGTATSADKKSNVVVHGNEQSLSDIKSMIQQMIPPDTTIEDRGKRYWYSYKHLANASDLPGTNWYVAVAMPSGVCAGQVSFKDSGGEAVAKQIVDTIGAAK